MWRQAQACTRCPQLASTRQTVVFGMGNADADLMFVGEAPGANEDKQGLPFVGQAGRLLETLLGEIGLERGGRLHLQRVEVQASRQPRSAAAGDRRLPGLPVPPARADPAAGGVHARELLDQAAAGRSGDRDHAAARARGDPADRAAAGAAVPDLPPGGGALHAEDARRPARGLPPAAGAAGARPARAARPRGRGGAGAGGGRAGAGRGAGAGAEPGSASPSRLSSGSSEPLARRP